MNLIDFDCLLGHLIDREQKLCRALELNELSNALSAIEGSCFRERTPKPMDCYVQVSALGPGAGLELDYT